MGKTNGFNAVAAIIIYGFKVGIILNTDLFISDWNEVNKTALIMAGIHPEEESGVYCISELIEDETWKNNNSDINMVCVPCRNKLGFNVRNVFNELGEFQGTLLADLDIGRLYLHGEDYYFVISIVSIHYGKRVFWNILNNKLSLHGVIGFVHIISLRNTIDIRANSYYFDGIKLIDLNNILRYPSKVGVEDVCWLIDEYNPDLVIDLHEGKKRESYVYVDDGSYDIGKFIIRNFERNGIEVRREADDRIAMYKGVFSLSRLNIWNSWEKVLYHRKMVVIETGNESDMEYRIQVMRIGVESCFEYLRKN